MTNETPKPKPPVKKTDGKQIDETKKTFVRKPHLTSRPFQNDGLAALRRSMNEEPRPRHPGEQPRRSTRNKKGSAK